MYHIIASDKNISIYFYQTICPAFGWISIISIVNIEKRLESSLVSVENINALEHEPARISHEKEE